MTHKELFSDAQWLMPETDLDAALFRSVFTAEAGEKAEITICGLGYFILYINGKRVSSDEFVPAYSDYHDRPDIAPNYPLNDIQTHRIYCMKYDISHLLCGGENIIGVMVGGGFYHQLIRRAEGNMTYGRIKLCYKIDFSDRTVFSDKNVVYKSGFFKKSNLFFGEVLDYTGFDRKWNTAEASSKDWKKAVVVSAPVSEYYIQECPSDKVTETLKPELVKNFGDYSVYQIPKNISGYPVVRCKNAGKTVILECAEEIFEDKNLNNESIGYGHQREIAEFVTDSEEIYHPWFCWFGFRYFSLTNNAEPVEVRVIHSDVDVTSGFECSDETLNWYSKAFINTQLCNMHGSIPSDCPHRERLGYTGDGQLTCDAVMTQLDTQSFYRKWIADIYDCQDKDTGHVQHTAPFAGGGGGPAGWGGAIITVPYMFYRHYGDKALLEEMFPNMDKFVDYMESRTENGLIVREEKDGWCLGDWCTPEKIRIPEPFVNTSMFIVQLEIMSETAKILGKSPVRYQNLIKDHRSALQKEYFGGSGYLDGIQGADAFALCSGLDGDGLLDNLAEKYNELGEFDTGIFGTYILLDTLYKNGMGELATKLLSNKKTSSFDFMRRAGATTIWENWNGEASHSHPMFGASTVFLFNYVLGIRQNKNSVAWNEVIIEPVFESFLDFAKGFITTPHGKIMVDWKRENGRITVNIDLCENISAVFRYGETEKKLSSGKNTFTL